MCLELNKGPLVNALRQYNWVVPFPANPQSLAKYRATFPTSRTEDAPFDARLQLDLLIKNPERLKPLTPQSTTVRALEQLVEHRRRLIGDKVRITNRITNRLTSILKSYVP